MVNGTTYHSILSPNRWHLVVSFHANHTQTTRCKKKKIAKMQGVKKDVERCFGFLQSQNLCKLWQIDAIYKIMIACVIMHNMIIKNKRDNNLNHCLIL
jgi:hypothetical protein